MINPANKEIWLNKESKLAFYSVSICICIVIKGLIMYSSVSSKYSNFLLSNFLNCLFSIVFSIAFNYSILFSSERLKNSNCFSDQSYFNNKISAFHCFQVSLISFFIKLIHSVLSLYFNPLLLSSISFFKLRPIKMPKISNRSFILTPVTILNALNIFFFTILTILSVYSYSLIGLLLFVLYLYVNNLNFMKIFMKLENTCEYNKISERDKILSNQEVLTNSSECQVINTKPSDDLYSKEIFKYSNHRSLEDEVNSNLFIFSIYNIRMFYERYNNLKECVQDSFNIFQVSKIGIFIKKAEKYLKNLNVSNMKSYLLKKFTLTDEKCKENTYLNEYSQDIDILGNSEGLKILKVEIYRCIIFGICFCLFCHINTIFNSIILLDSFMIALLTSIIDFIFYKIASKYPKRLYTTLKAAENSVKLIVMGLSGYNIISRYQISCVIGIIVTNYLVQLSATNK